MKEMKMLILFLLCALMLTGCGGGDVSAVTRHIGECEFYSKSEVTRAMDAVEAYFKKEFDGCKLLRLEHDEEETLAEAHEWAARYETGKAIVLESDFYVGPGGGEGSLVEDEMYEDWKWILVKTAFGWEVKTCGYG